LNEISADQRSRRTVKSFLKMLVTDRSVQAERKFRDAETVALFANVLITSNEVAPLEIEPGDRRYTVVKTGGPLKKAGWRFPESIHQIRRELPSFARFLSEYEIDGQAYNTALDTPEKRALCSMTTDRFRFFVSKLTGRDVDHFMSAAGEGGTLSQASPAEVGLTLQQGYEVGFTVDALHRLFQAVTDDDGTTKRGLMKKLRSIEPMIFAVPSPGATKGSGQNYKSDGTVYFRV
jgi:hypothetical protein